MSISNLSEPSHGDISADRKNLTPCSIVIFGASGDLTARKLIPALYHLAKDKQMPPAFRIIGFARREKTDESWRAVQAVVTFSLEVRQKFPLPTS